MATIAMGSPSGGIGDFAQFSHQESGEIQQLCAWPLSGEALYTVYKPVNVRVHISDDHTDELSSRLILLTDRMTVMKELTSA